MKVQNCFSNVLHSEDENEDTSSGFPGETDPQSNPPGPSMTTNG